LDHILRIVAVAKSTFRLLDQPAVVSGEDLVQGREVTPAISLNEQPVITTRRIRRLCYHKDATISTSLCWVTRRQKEITTRRQRSRDSYGKTRLGLQLRTPTVIVTGPAGSPA
jgi:hypothetical protein